MSTYNSSVSVILSDTINIPQPGVIASGTSTGATNQLIDAATDFLPAVTNALGYIISGGDVVYTNGEIFTVVSVDDANTITLSGNPAQAATYQIYKSNAANISEGYSLYFGTTGNAVVEDVSGNQVTLSNIPAGKIIDLLVVKVLSSGSTALTDIIALQNI
jgi:hypothetical protein